MICMFNTLLLADVFENFQNLCLEIYELDPSKFLSAPGTAWQGALKNTEVKLDLRYGIRKKILEEEFVSVFIDMQKSITNT